MSLSARMAEKSSELIKILMKLGLWQLSIRQLMEILQNLLLSKLGHTPKRVSDSDVEQGLGGKMIMIQI